MMQNLHSLRIPADSSRPAFEHTLHGILSTRGSVEAMVDDGCSSVA